VRFVIIHIGSDVVNPFGTHLFLFFCWRRLQKKQKRCIAEAQNSDAKHHPLESNVLHQCAAAQRETKIGVKSTFAGPLEDNYLFGLSSVHRNGAKYLWKHSKRDESFASTYRHIDTDATYLNAGPMAKPYEGERRHLVIERKD
jgi:hypothetical protein